MDTTKNVRERRMEKLRKLQEGVDSRAGRRPDVSHMHFPQVDERRELYPSRLDRLEEDPYASLRVDPEVEWNRKWKREFTEYRRNDDDLGPPERDGSWRGRISARILVSGLLFALTWGMFHVHHPLAEKGKKWITTALTESVDASSVAAWYERKFGSAPSFLPALNPAKHQDAEKVSAVTKHYFTPVQGKLIAAFTPGQSGVLVDAKSGTPVAAVDTGLVTFAGMKEDTGFTVVLRHTDGVESIYGHLAQGKIQLNDWIKGGETLGTVDKPQGQASGTLFFALAKDGKPLNPTDVITFD
ncbi:M23 family metallopeptidase [Paenibacillus cremeus]|uniref:M23 family metallopeptidase n=1 Tax=Paenibacillus cremeus TaxID=2163881 RepID=A0A559KIH2_9BACL|nr:M23 family metallopeptidase [Paenibacillus cremeus]TVY11909.1 M23 family metallopeptidase [Paenibacillus cremeus]